MQILDLDFQFILTCPSRLPPPPKKMPVIKQMEDFVLSEGLCNEAQSAAWRLAVQCRSPYPIPYAVWLIMQTGWARWASEHGLGSVTNFKLCACSLNPPYPHSVKQHKGIMGYRRLNAGFRAADSLMMSVRLLNGAITTSINVLKLEYICLVQNQWWSLYFDRKYNQL